jgi:uncharacterized phage protein (TIGR01671 family)
MNPKFRAWDKIQKKMGVVISNNWMTGVANIIIDNKETLRQEQDYILMKSTGIKDKNGTEIFEGDIIDTTDYEGGLSSVGNPLVKVEHDKYGFVVTGDFPDSPITLKEFEAGRKFAGVEVIIAGNIYENPELVEVIND